MNQTENNHSHENCLSIFKRLSEYLDDELDITVRAEIKSHIEACVRCKVCLETLRRTIELLKNFESKSIPERVKEHLKRMTQKG